MKIDSMIKNLNIPLPQLLPQLLPEAKRTSPNGAGGGFLSKGIPKGITAVMVFWVRVFIINMGAMSLAHALSPKDGTVVLPVPVTEVSQSMMTLLRDSLLPAIALLLLALIVLIVYISWRFDFSRHPMASDNNRNVFIQTAWLGATGVFLVVVMTSYFKIMDSRNKMDNMQLTIVVTALDTGWQYVYQDENVTVQSSGIKERYLKPGQRRLMTTNAPLVLPEKSNIQLLFTSSGQPRRWHVPELGITVMANQGRFKRAWFNTEEPGNYYGLCNAGCGVNHLTTPVEVRIIPRREFASWLDVARQSAELNSNRTQNNN